MTSKENFLRLATRGVKANWQDASLFGRPLWVMDQEEKVMTLAWLMSNPETFKMLEQHK